MKQRDNDARKTEWQHQWRQFSRELVCSCVGTQNTASPVAFSRDTPTFAFGIMTIPQKFPVLIVLKLHTSVTVPPKGTSELWSRLVGEMQIGKSIEVLSDSRSSSYY